MGEHATHDGNACASCVFSCGCVFDTLFHKIIYIDTNLLKRKKALLRIVLLRFSTWSAHDLHFSTTVTSSMQFTETCTKLKKSRLLERLNFFCIKQICMYIHEACSFENSV